jgi:uncharacterized protein
MKQEFSPRALNVLAFSINAESYAGEERLARFERLMDESQGLGGDAMVNYSVRGEMRQDAAGVDEPWLMLSAQTSLALVCQRCMGPVDVPVAFDRSFRFVPTEELAAVEDEESDEDVLVLSKSFDLLELIEDELLMTQPLVPKHETCPVAIQFEVADADFVDETPTKPNPFAVLQSLKKDSAG